MNKTINILGWTNGGGLSRDIDVLREALRELGYTVFVNRRLDGEGFRGWIARTLKRVHASRVGKAVTAGGWVRPPFDLTLHIEDIHGGLLWLAKRNVLIPNQEWFREWCRPYLPGIDEVWAKSRLAQRLFAELGCNVRFLGWSSEDRSTPGACGGKTLTGLHIAGASKAKGTETVLDVWSRNPGWPLLRVLRRPRGYGGKLHPWRERPDAANIQILSEPVDEATLLQWQNESALWVRPSEAEGFGHALAEGMSVGAVVITTDAPPMNELVTPDSGLLVAVDRSEPMGLGQRYFVDPLDLEEKIRAALHMTDAEREALGRAARARFEAMNAGFRERLKTCLAAILDVPAGQVDEPVLTSE